MNIIKTAKTLAMPIVATDKTIVIQVAPGIKLMASLVVREWWATDEPGKIKMSRITRDKAEMLIASHIPVVLPPDVQEALESKPKKARKSRAKKTATV